MGFIREATALRPPIDPEHHTIAAFVGAGIETCLEQIVAFLCEDASSWVLSCQKAKQNRTEYIFSGVPLPTFRTSIIHLQNIVAHTACPVTIVEEGGAHLGLGLPSVFEQSSEGECQ